MREVDKDILISRIVDDEAGGPDWAAFEALARADAGLWRELAQAQREHSALCRGVGSALACAEAVEAPAHLHEGLGRRARVVAMWAGWAAAAAVALAWVGVGPGLDPGTTGEGQVHAAGVFGSASEALQRYLELGREQGTVLEELPEHEVVDAVAHEDGLRVIYIRRIVEQRVVDEVYKPAQDELGRTMQVPVRLLLSRPDPL
jgi:hypothetical protein